mmetsp:Transcript_14762/g.35202  ORF Transcript_14762/g.35202 Transcript_14762/m.35202 type:complete len:221 (-) Transcript_14762:138-800(-)
MTEENCSGVNSSERPKSMIFKLPPAFSTLLGSCSIITFSGLRSLCMILFSWQCARALSMLLRICAASVSVKLPPPSGESSLGALSRISVSSSLPSNSSNIRYRCVASSNASTMRMMLGWSSFLRMVNSWTMDSSGSAVCDLGTFLTQRTTPLCRCRALMTTPNRPLPICSWRSYVASIDCFDGSLGKKKSRRNRICGSKCLSRMCSKRSRKKPLKVSRSS